MDQRSQEFLAYVQDGGPVEATDWLPDGLLYCPCHFTKYDPRDGAAVIDGPAPRPLPALPLKIVDGKLTVAGPFTARVAFQQE